MDKGPTFQQVYLVLRTIHEIGACEGFCITLPPTHRDCLDMGSGRQLTLQGASTELEDRRGTFLNHEDQHTLPMDVPSLLSSCYPPARSSLDKLVGLTTIKPGRTLANPGP